MLTVEPSSRLDSNGRVSITCSGVVFGALCNFLSIDLSKSTISFTFQYQRTNARNMKNRTRMARSDKKSSKVVPMLVLVMSDGWKVVGETGFRRLTWS